MRQFYTFEVQHTNLIQPVYMCPKCFKLYRAKGPYIKVNDIVEFELENDEQVARVFYNAPVIARTELLWESPCCESADLMIPLDGNVAQAVQRLNESGYQTMFSCEGHWQPQYDDPDKWYGTLWYIMLKLTKKQRERIEHAIKQYEYLGCRIKLERSPDGTAWCLRADHPTAVDDFLSSEDGISEEEFYRIKKVSLDALYGFIDGLLMSNLIRDYLN